MEDSAPGGCGREHAVDDHAVDMQVGIQGGTEAMDEGHRPESGRGAGARTVRPQALFHRAREQPSRRALQSGSRKQRSRFGTARTHCLTGKPRNDVIG